MEPTLPLAEAGLDCTIRGQTFQHSYTLRRRQLYVHGVIHHTGPAFNPARDAADGRPI